MDHINQINFNENMNFINSLGYLNKIDNEFKSVLAGNILKEFYDTDKYIIRGNLN